MNNKKIAELFIELQSLNKIAILDELQLVRKELLNSFFTAFNALDGVKRDILVQINDHRAATFCSFGLYTDQSSKMTAAARRGGVVWCKSEYDTGLANAEYNRMHLKETGANCGERTNRTRKVTDFLYLSAKGEIQVCLYFGNPKRCRYFRNGIEISKEDFDGLRNLSSFRDYNKTECGSLYHNVKITNVLYIKHSGQIWGVESR